MASKIKKQLTKKFLIQTARKAGLEAHQLAMQRFGYVIQARDGWLIKLWQDGRIEQLSKLDLIDAPLALD